MKQRSLLIPLFILFASCKASDELEFSLTPITQTGANTFSCTIDGSVFQPYGRRCFGYGGGPCIDEPLSVHYYPKHGQLQISAFLTAKNRSENIDIECDSLFKTGLVSVQRQHSYTPAGLSYSTNSLNYGIATATIDITRLDTAAHIVSGTFEGILQPYLVGSTTQVSITDGRFDVKYGK